VPANASKARRSILKISNKKKNIPMKDNTAYENASVKVIHVGQSVTEDQSKCLVEEDQLPLLQGVENGDDRKIMHVAGHPIDWADLELTLPPRIWFMDRWLTTVPTLFAALGGTGKSLELQTMCTGLAIGKPYLDAIEKPRTCLVWSCEDDYEEILRRQAKINHFYGVKEARELKRLHVIPRIGCDNVLVELSNGKLVRTAAFKLLKEQLNDLRAEVLVLDNVAHMYGGIDERTQVTQFVNWVTGLVRDRPFAPIFVTHVSRSAGSEFAGSVAWENAVRMRWYLQSVKEGDDGDGDNRLIQRIGKSNVSPKTFCYLRYVNDVIAPESPREVAEGIKKRAASKEKRCEAVETILINAFEMLRTMNVRICAKRNSRDGLVAQICKRSFGGDATKEELNEALDRLESGSRVETEIDGKYGNGGPYVVIKNIIWGTQPPGVRAVA
jgi:RecA-family ATPase